MIIWRSVVGYESLYEVSNTGIVRSMDRLGTDRRKLKGKVLSPKLNSKKGGYFTVSLYKNNQKKTKYIHRIVAESFIDNHDSSKHPLVNHIDGDKKNNMADNLEWTDSYGNMQHAWDNGLMKNVTKNLIEKWGKNCKLIDTSTSEEISFDSWESVSLYLGYNKHWLSKAYSCNTNYIKACLKKGYHLLLEVDQ